MDIQKQKGRKSSSLLSCTSNSDKNKSVKNNKKQQSIMEEDISVNSILSKTKTDLIEIYRIIRKHVKDNNYTFQESQLKDVYQKLSVNLKQIQKSINQTQSLKSTSNANSICINQSQSQGILHIQQSIFDPTSISLPNCQYNSTDSANNIGLNDSSLNSQSIANMDKKLISSQSLSVINSNYLLKIKELERSIEQLKQLNSQEIRTLIQNNQEQMMFVEKECEIKFINYKKQAEQEIEFIQSQLQSKIQQLSAINLGNNQQSEKLKSVKKELEHEINRHRVLELQLKKTEQNFKQKQEKYTEIIQKFMERFKNFKSYHQTQFKQQFVVKLHKLQRFFQKFYQNLQRKGKQNKQKQINYTKLIFTKLQELTKDTLNISGNQSKIYPLTTKGLNSQNTSKSEKTNNLMSLNSGNINSKVLNEQNINQEQMIFGFNQADCWLRQQNPYQIMDQSSLEQIITKLFEFGFFRQQNVQNIKGLIDLDRQMSQGTSAIDVASHSLFPILLEKIKLTTTKNQMDLGLGDFIPQIESGKNNYFASNNNLKSSISRSNTSNINMHSSNNLRRHIASIQELDVSDSMLRDDSFQQNKQSAPIYPDQLF